MFLHASLKLPSYPSIFLSWIYFPFLTPASFVFSYAQLSNKFLPEWTLHSDRLAVDRRTGPHFVFGKATGGFQFGRLYEGNRKGPPFLSLCVCCLCVGCHHIHSIGALIALASGLLSQGTSDCQLGYSWDSHLDRRAFNRIPSESSKTSWVLFTMVYFSLWSSLFPVAVTKSRNDLRSW